jgi:hypothetical protein
MRIFVAGATGVLGSRRPGQVTGTVSGTPNLRQ